MDSEKAIILMAYGTPEKPEDIEPYYTHIRGGRKPTKKELMNLEARYTVIGGLSPLLRITRSTAEKLEKRLRQKNHELSVYAGMKHSHPFIFEVIERIVSEGNTKLLAVALAPHYSKMSIGGYEDAASKANLELGNKLDLEFVDQWYLNKIFVVKWSERIREAKSRYFPHEDAFYLFSAHSLPEKILAWSDPYKDQLLESSRKIATMLGLRSSEFDFCFQSAGHTSEPWLGPDILERISQLAIAGKKNILSVPIGFVSDHLEILFDIDKEAKDLAHRLGIKLERTPSFNDSDDFIDILESVVGETGFLS